MKLILKKINENIIPLFFIISLSLYTWHTITQMALRGVSFFYLVKRLQDYYWHSLESLTTFGLGAVLLGKTFTSLFSVNLIPYQLAELVIMTLINIIFYFCVLTITKKKIVAFAASLMFGVNYFGNFDMYAGGIYAYFLERIPNMLFLIPSLLFLHLFLERKIIKYYFISFLLYFLGVGLFHWSILFTGPYLFYPFCWYLFKEKNIISIIRGLILGLPYFATSGFFVILQGIFDKQNGVNRPFLDFVLQPQVYHYPEMMLRQLVYLSEYYPLLRGFSLSPLKYIATPMHYLMNIQNAADTTIYVSVVYLLATIIIYYRLPKYRFLLLTTILSVASIFFLNAYFGQYQIATQPGANRYLYLPNFFLVLFWSLFLWAIFWQMKSKKMIWGLVIVGAYYVINTWMISQNFQWLLDRDYATKKIWNYVIDQRPTLAKGTVVVMPNFETGPYEAEFLTDWLGNGQVKYLTDGGALKDLATDGNNVIVVTYSNVCKCVLIKDQ